MGVWGVSRTPWPPLPPGKTRYPLYRRLGGPQGRSGRTENLVPTGIRSPTVQPVVNRYTDWATRPTNKYSNAWITDLFSTKNFRLTGWFWQATFWQTDMLISLLKVEWFLPCHPFLPIFNKFFLYLGMDGRTISISIERRYSEINTIITEKLWRPILIQFLLHRKQNRCLL